jgi:predicted transcriptional regulator
VKQLNTVARELRKNRHVTVTISDKQKGELEEIARITRRSMGEVIRQGIELFITKNLKAV